MIAVLYALLVASLALCFGRSMVDAMVFRWEVDRVTRWALSFPALVLFSFVLMLVHLATGGAILSNPWLTRGLTLVTAIVCVALNLWRRPRLPHERLLRWQVWTLLALCALGVVVWGLPIAHVWPLNFTPDTDLHMGWASQLMIGESSPSTVVTGDVPGYYPWLYHALVALLARFTPGGRAFDALGAVQLLQVVGVVSGLFAVGRYMTNKFVTGAAAAFFGSMCGGFGVGMLFDEQLRDEAAHLPATAIPWLGDVLSRRPYNFGFNNVAPAYPRDLSFSLLVGFLLLLLIGLKRRSYVALAAGGVALGLVGLAGGEAVIVGAGAALVICLLQKEVNPIRALGAVVLPMLAVYGTWLGPLILNYIDLGGFVNTTHVGPVVLTFPFLILSWGLTTPFALLGLAASFRSLREPGVLIPLAIVLIAGLIMASNLAYEALGNAFLTLGRDHRYWALCHLGLALFAALGVTAVLERMRRFPAVAVVTAALVVGLGVVSPVLGSTIYPEKFPANPTIAASLEGDVTYLNAMAPEPGMRCVAAVPGNGVARQTFSYTGYRLVQWVTAEDRENWARIRWADIYRYIPDDLERARSNRILTRGLASPDMWAELAERFDVNFVLVPRTRADSAVFEGFPQQDFSMNKKSFTLVRVKDC
jgi:hypothetical protein